MHKKQVIIASLLKPINDTRMFEKLGNSINKVNGFEVKIVGFRGKIPQVKGIRFFPLFQFARLQLWQRLLAPFRFYSFLRKNSPDILIIGTHELLWPAYFYCLSHSCSLVYDIRENYFLNILRGGGFISPIRPLLSWYVRIKEYISSGRVKLFLLAENVYSQQLGFIKDRWIYLPNTVAEVPLNQGEKDPFRLLFSGTLANETGVFEAIQLAESFYREDPRYHLLIIGFCPQSSVMRKLEKYIDDKPFIEIQGGTEMVDHSMILEAIKSSGYGIISYQQLPQFRGKIPTKVFEYLYFQLPIIILKNSEIRDLIGNNAYFLDEINDKSFQSISNQDISKDLPSFPLAWSEKEDEFLSALKKI